MSNTNISVVLVGGYNVRTDGDLVSLNDLYALAGSPKNQEPWRWKDTEQALQLIDTIAIKLNLAKNEVYVSKRGRHGGGSWGHKLLAVEYSGYLSPELKLKINDTFLRAEAGDVTLAAEIAERASPEDQRRLAIRVEGIVRRNALTQELCAHKVNGVGFAQCTDATYIGAFGATAKEIRQLRQLPAKSNLREAMTAEELETVMLSEIVSRRTLEANPKIQGNYSCAKVCEQSSLDVMALLNKAGQVYLPR